MRIRRASEADTDAVLAIVNGAIRESHAHFGTTPNTGQDVRGWLDVAARYPFLVSETPDGEVAGFARAGRWKPREGYAWTVEVGVYVATRWQGRGVGRALYDALFPAIEALEYRTVIAGVALPNEASVRLHESMGMRLAGTLPRAGFKLGRWIDVAYYTKHFGDGAPT